MRMKCWGKQLLVLCLVGLLASFAQAKEKTIKMSTTTSTQASGLLDVLLPELNKQLGIQVKVIAKGTGAAIRDGMDGNVDVIFVHARAREEQFIANGFGTKRYAVMHNDFVIVGPASDPAGVRQARSLGQALNRIAAGNAGFVSRGDDSGTHIKEQSLWQTAGLKLASRSATVVKKGKKKQVTYQYPAQMGARYLSIGRGMGPALTFADEKQAYTLTDRGTYIKFKLGRKPALALDIMFEGDPALNNPYGVIPINPTKHPHVNHTAAKQFAEWLVSPGTQKLIEDYKLMGKQLFFPDALAQ